jgi:hypothetical protein
MLSRYYDKTAIEAEVAAGRHRESVGGLWEAIGRLQADFLVSPCLQPHHHLLDIGCGSLRGGAKLISYLDAGNYVGTDLNEGCWRLATRSSSSKPGLRTNCRGPIW